MDINALESPAKRPKLLEAHDKRAESSSPAVAPHRPQGTQPPALFGARTQQDRHASHGVPRCLEGADGPLVIMLHDLEEASNGTFHLWGTCGKRTVLLKVPDFAPYWFVPSPASDQGPQHCTLAQLTHLQSLLNMRLPHDCHVTSITQHHFKPIMYYRSNNPDGELFLRLSLKPGSSLRKAANAVHAVLKGGQLAPHGFKFPNRQDYESDVKPLTRFMCDLSLSGGSWLYLVSAAEGDAGFRHVATRDRVSSCDMELEASWTCLQSLTPDATQLADLSWEPQVVTQMRQQQQQQQDDTAHQQHASVQASISAALQGSILPLKVLTLDVLMAPADCTARMPSVQTDPVIAIACELFTERFGGGGEEQQQGGTQQQGQGSTEGVRRDLGPELARAAGRPAASEAISLISDTDDQDEIEDDDDEHVMMIDGGPKHTSARPATSHNTNSTEKVIFLLSGPAHGSNKPGHTSTPHSSAGSNRGSAAAGGAAAAAAAGVAVPGLRPGQELKVEGARVVVCGSESDLLLTWREWVASRDPDAVATFQVRDTLGALAARAATIKLDASKQVTGISSPPVRPGLMAPGLYLSRLHLQASKPLASKSVVMYSAAWVKSQSRMASTSNQETFKMQGFSGRLVFDVLRQVLTHQSLATFTLVDCVHSILHETMEVLAPFQLAQLWKELQGQSVSAAAARAAPSTTANPPVKSASSRGASAAAGKANKAVAGGSSSTAKRPPVGPEAKPALTQSPAAAAARLARYCFRRTGAVRALLRALATIPESFEMARVTGLSLNEVQYKAQMVRTCSLLLRNARRHGYLVGGRQEVGQLVESPYLMHPLEHKTAAFYTAPVACLDFASLYPSLYRAYNLCYTTLVVSEDVAAVGQDHITITPSGHAFLKPNIRQGILPTILAALMTARSRTREALKALGPGSSPAAKAVLDSRQKALKVTANALYGFTGAQASPLQCVPLADSCLALGAQACRTAIQAVGTIHAKGLLGDAGRGARVIYGQTDSLFILFPHATPAQAVGLGKQVAKLVTEGWCVPPMQLQYERICAPFLLLHVNRYAGRSFETEDQAASCRPTGLLVKGVRSMWRQSAPFVQHTLQGALERIIMQADIPGAVRHAEDEIRRLLSGRIELWELVMTGGLWRVTGQQVAAAAAAADGGVPAGASAGGEGSSEDVKGPHATLAIKLAQRDPGRTFLLGERIQHVLLTGARLQDDAAEDPLLAAELGLSPNLELYWKNKLQTPLSEIFDKVLTPAQLQSLLSGSHTLVRVEQLSASTSHGNPELDAAGAAAAGVGAAAGHVDISRAGPVGKKGGSGGGGKQSGLMSFFKQTYKCLACRQTLSDDWVTAHKTTDNLAPGLCAACLAEGRAAEMEMSLVDDANVQQEQLTSAVSQCMRCHSGGLLGQVACSNAECKVLYNRLGAARRLAGLDVRLRRLDLHDVDTW